MSHAIQTESLTKRFRGAAVVDQLSLSVPEGSVFGLLGETGAGKTTTIRMLLGLTDPDAGRADVLGLDSVRRGRQIRQRVGYVPEQPCLYDWMTVEEIGWFTAGFYKNGYLDTYRQLAREFELEPSQKIRELSKGMRAKVSLALALASEPRLLVLDEPTSGLDLMVRREFLESMVDLARPGRTVFLSSHQVAEVERVADFIAILRRGRLVACEPLEKLKETVCELLLTLSDASAELPPLDAQVLQLVRSDRQCRIIARGVDAGALEKLRSLPHVQDAALRSLSLEEIFTAYMQAPEG